MEYELIRKIEENGENYEKIINDYVCEVRDECLKLDGKQLKELLLSEFNYGERAKLKSCRLFDMTIMPGDICYIDYGKAYILETGYQHFGLVLNVFDAKAFVIPMTSNPKTYIEAYDEFYNPNGIRHLMRLGKQEGLYKYSVLFLNDGKYINTARIINKKGHIDVESPLFKSIVKEFISHLLL